LRLWNIEQQLQNKSVIKLKSGGGLRCPVTACAFSPNDGKLIAGAGFDGSLQVHVLSMNC
jgi:hypothetical protein